MIDKENNRILVVDINYITSDLKDKSTEEIRKYFETEYGCKVILLDGSRANTQGALQTNPLYFI